MTILVDGPAAGKTMMLRRAVMLLRVTRKRRVAPDYQSEEFDALDQPEDTPKPDEEIFVYVNTSKHSGTAHVRYGGNKRHLSGFYAMAEYRLYDLQPPDAILRDNDEWCAWCETQRKRLGL